MQLNSIQPSFTSCSPKSFRRAANSVLNTTKGLNFCTVDMEKRLLNAINKGTDKTSFTDMRLIECLKNRAQTLNVKI